MAPKKTHNVHVSCEHDHGGKNIRSITVTFGQGNRVKITSHRGRPALQMSSGESSVMLDAATDSPDLLWAVRLLEDRLPQLRGQMGLYEPEGDTPTEPTR